jgi:hypothetical protein
VKRRLKEIFKRSDEVVAEMELTESKLNGSRFPGRITMDEWEDISDTSAVQEFDEIGVRVEAVLLPDVLRRLSSQS